MRNSYYPANAPADGTGTNLPSHLTGRLYPTDLNAALIEANTPVYTVPIEAMANAIKAGKPLPPHMGFKYLDADRMAVVNLGAFADTETLYVIEFVDTPEETHFHTVTATLKEWFDHFGSRPNQHYTAHVVGYKDPAEVAGLTDLQRGLILEVYDPFEVVGPVRPDSVTPTMWDKLEPDEQLFLHDLVTDNALLRNRIESANKQVALLASIITGK